MHLKRLAAPRSWKLARKEAKFATKPSPGPHPTRHSIPLMLVLREILGYAKTAREAKIVFNERRVIVDGRVRTNPKFPVGLMDVIEIPVLKKAWVVLLDKSGKFTLAAIPKSRAKEKLCRIVNKTIVRGGHLQLNLHDGRNILVKIKDPKSPKEDKYKTRDTLIYDFAKNRIKGIIPFTVGSLALVTGGTHRGNIAKIESRRILRSPQPNIVVLANDKGRFETIENYVFMVGEKKAMVPEVG
ncbi:MAG: 30S ribosomal protein S4e [Candidatus Hydrothermarchaeaceae archaeon]